MASLLHVGTATTRGGLSTYEDWVLDELEAAGHTIGAYKQYSDSEVTSGYDAVVVHARGAHGLGTRYRNCGMPTVGTGRGDLVTTGGGWGHATSTASGSGNNMYYDDSTAVTWTGKTVDTAIDVNAFGTKVGASAGLDADALIVCRNTDSGGNPTVWVFDAGEVVDGQTLSAKMAFLGFDSTYWQAGVANAAGEQLLLDIVDWLVDSGAPATRLLDRRRPRRAGRIAQVRAAHY